MAAEIIFREVAAGDQFEGLTFEVEEGRSAMVVTSGEVEGTILLRLITGLSRPSRGSVHIFGQSLEELTAPQLCQMRQQIGVVPANGGMISNLKLWENITLPLHYTMGHIPVETEDYVINYLNKLGSSGNLMALPAHLSLHEKRVAAFIRATLCSPRIMVYDHCFEDTSVGARTSFTSAISEFHAASPERISLYLVSSADMVRNLPVDVVIYVHNSDVPTVGTA